MKSKIIEIVIQIIPVMIGVYLAFLVSNWAEQRKSRNESKHLMENIRSEMEANKKHIQSVVDYHVMLRDSSRFYSKPENPISGTDFFEGTKMMTLINSAYQTGIQTGVINELNIDQIQELNQLYTLQQSYNDYGNVIISGLINKDFTEDEATLKSISRFLSMTMNDVVSMEKRLLKEYDELSEELK